MVTLEEEGDYVIWSAGTPHNWFVLEDSTSVTVRWPSLPNDQQVDPAALQVGAGAGLHLH